MRVFGRTLAVLLLVALLVAVGYGIWNAGYDHGVIDGASATEIVVADRYGGGFFPFGAIFGLFFLFLLFGMVSRFAFGWRRWAPSHMGYGPRGYRTHMEERLARWHDEAHGRRPLDDEAQPPGPVS